MTFRPREPIANQLRNCIQRQCMFSDKSTFPNGHNTPTTFKKLRNIPLVSFPISTKLLSPEFLTGHGNS